MSIVTIIQGGSSQSELLNDDNCVVGQLSVETKENLIRTGIPERIVNVE